MKKKLYLYVSSKRNINIIFCLLIGSKPQNKNFFLIINLFYKVKFEFLTDILQINIYMKKLRFVFDHFQIKFEIYTKKKYLTNWIFDGSVF